MKELNMIVWLTHLGLSVASPLVLCVLGAVWLRGRFGLGGWVIVAGVILGGWMAALGFRQSLKMMEYMSKGKSKNDREPPIGFNEHN